MNILDKITAERRKRNWSEYQLAQNSGIPQSTISTWYRKNMQPSVASLEKICQGLGITLGEFFSETEAVELSEDQKQILDRWSALRKDQKEALLTLVDSLLH